MVVQLSEGRQRAPARLLLTTEESQLYACDSHMICHWNAFASLFLLVASLLIPVPGLSLRPCLVSALHLSPLGGHTAGPGSTGAQGTIASGEWRTGEKLLLPTRETGRGKVTLLKDFFPFLQVLNSPAPFPYQEQFCLHSLY